MRSRHDSNPRATPAAALTLVLSLLLVPGVLQAQQQMQPANPDPDREELVRFTEAYVEILDVRADMEADMAQAGSAEQAAQAQEQANQEMMAILDEYAFTPERYAEITNLLNNNPELRAEFQEIFEEIDS